MRNAVKMEEKRAACGLCVKLGHIGLKYDISDKDEEPLHITLPALHQPSVVFLGFGYVNRPKLGGGGLLVVINACGDIRQLLSYPTAKHTLFLGIFTLCLVDHGRGCQKVR
jgi:hypothetical protein